MSLTSSAPVKGKTLRLLYLGWFACAALVVVILFGALPGYFSNTTPVMGSLPNSIGQFTLPFQVLLRFSDLLSGFISLLLAALLLRYKPNDRMALFSSFFLLITAVASGNALDYFLTAYFGTPSTYHLYASLQTPLWILLFCIFPDGRFVPGWTRWVFLAFIPLSLSIFANQDVFILVQWVEYPLFFLVGYAQVVRYRHVSNVSQRKQTRWVLFGIVLSMFLAVIASLINRAPSPPLVNIIPIMLTTAILRSHLWDIDILIRKTFTYGIIISLLALIYGLSVITLQFIFTNISGQRSEVVTVLSTLAIAALFNPLRRRVQDFIDRRFYRKKYDAEKALAEFAAAARNETDLGQISARLTSTVQEALQPEQVSLWLKPAINQPQIGIQKER